jgi:hypothetical protein
LYCLLYDVIGFIRSLLSSFISYDDIYNLKSSLKKKGKDLYAQLPSQNSSNNSSNEFKLSLSSYISSSFPLFLSSYPQNNILTPSFNSLVSYLSNLIHFLLFENPSFVSAFSWQLVNYLPMYFLYLRNEIISVIPSLISPDFKNFSNYVPYKFTNSSENKSDSFLNNNFSLVPILYNNDNMYFSNISILFVNANFPSIPLLSWDVGVYPIFSIIFCSVIDINSEIDNKVVCPIFRESVDKFIFSSTVKLDSLLSKKINDFDEDSLFELAEKCFSEKIIFDDQPSLLLVNFEVIKLNGVDVIFENDESMKLFVNLILENLFLFFYEDFENLTSIICINEPIMSLTIFYLIRNCSTCFVKFLLENVDPNKISGDSMFSSLLYRSPFNCNECLRIFKLLNFIGNVCVLIFHKEFQLGSETSLLSLTNSIYLKPLLFFINCLCDQLGPPSAPTLCSVYSLFYFVNNVEDTNNNSIVFNSLLFVLINRCCSISDLFSQQLSSNKSEFQSSINNNTPWGLQAVLSEILKDKKSLKLKNAIDIRHELSSMNLVDIAEDIMKKLIKVI